MMLNRLDDSSGAWKGSPCWTGWRHFRGGALVLMGSGACSQCRADCNHLYVEFKFNDKKYGFCSARKSPMPESTGMARTLDEIDRKYREDYGPNGKMVRHGTSNASYAREN
jgi:hypothetical protein